MSVPTLRQRFRYTFDSFMARGGSSIFLALVVVFTTAIIVLGTIRGLVNAFVTTAAEREGGFLHQVYQTFNHLSDPGTMAYDIDSSPWFKLTAILAGMVGVVIFSSLIAFITTALDQKIRELKKGHSKVIEEGHTLILGWNERVVEILKELVIANESEDDACVVILSDRDKEEMDDYLKVNLPDMKNTRVVTRSGSLSNLANLDIVSVDRCKSVIVLAHSSQGGKGPEKAASDAMVIRTVLAVVATRPDDTKLNIVAEVFHERNREIVKQIAPDEVSTVDTDEILAKILVQTSRSVGLSLVYSEILSFDGCEMYFHHADWGEIRFGDLAYHWPDGVPMGLRHSDGSLSVNPSPDTMVRPDDDVLILAEDDSTIEYVAEPVATPEDIPLADGRLKMARERVLVIGWTPKVEILLREFANYVLEGSEFDVMLRAPDDAVRGEVDRIDRELSEVTIRLLEQDPLSTDGLLSVEPSLYDDIIILSQAGDADDEGRTDSETIVILLLLRQLFDKHPGHRKTRLITEVLDSENQPLVSRTGVQDFVISNRFVSMLLAQISEDADIQRVYDDLFEEEGSEIYLKPASLYFSELPREVSFADMMGVAQKREEVCIGVRLKEFEHYPDRNHGVKLIPEKNARFTIGPDDALVVVAEDET